MPSAAVSGNVLGPALSITNTNLSNSSIGIYATGSSTGVSGNGQSRGVYGYGQTFGTGVFGQSSGNGDGVYGVSNAGNGVYGFSNTGHGGYFLTNGSANHYGVWGQSNQTGGIGVYGTSPGSGVYGYSESGTGTVGYSNGVANGQGVYGVSTGSNGLGVHGVANSGAASAGVEGESTSGTGVYGSGYEGVAGFGTYRGVDGASATGNGVYGQTSGGFGHAGIYGTDFGTDGAGVYGTADFGPNAVGVRGHSSSGYAGYFDGTVHVEGTFSASAKNFKIDDPLDPANKYLYHASVESPDMMDIYNGNVTTDANGEAIVQLPDYFEALNKDFRYQLTTIGQHADAWIAGKIKENHFSIQTDKPNVEVSWQVTGIRHDPYADNNRSPVEQDKGAEDKGKYLYPEGYGQPQSKKINAWPQQEPGKVQVPQP